MARDDPDPQRERHTEPETVPGIVPDTVLDNDLRLLVGYGIKRANSALSADFERLLGRFGLRRSTYSALSVVADNPGVRQSDVADVLAIERPNLVQILDELLRAAWIVRARDPSDRRVYRLTATVSGIAHRDRARDVLVEHDQRLTQGWDPAERLALLAALRRVERMGGEAWEGRDVGTVSG